jgi:6,7-dimethyl-8-ribityllumazine synthase
MIKSVTSIRKVSSRKDWEALTRALEAIGFEAGPRWKDGPAEGASLLGPAGSVEVYFGKSKAAAVSDLLIEVNDLDHARATLVSNLKGAKLAKIEATDWNSSIFRLGYAGLKCAFWQPDFTHKLRYQTIEGDLHVAGARFGIVVSRFNAFITERLLKGALDALHRTGARREDVTVVRVPGAFEVPIAALKLAKAGKVDAVICLGLLMRGETSNYEHISDEVARGIGDAAQRSGIPCSYGVLTCDTLDQAIDRAGLKSGNKGFEAAIAAVEMVSLARRLNQPPRAQRRAREKRKKIRSRR